MATLVLTIVGSIFGGPLGGAIGGMIGQQIDQAVFAPPGRKGPRLNELATQSSNYGSKIPKIYGTMRVAGTVIWATDLKESSSTSGGKGQPSVTSYTYSASFAVVISARPIKGVGRVWADSKLLRGAAGDFKTQIGSPFGAFTGGSKTTNGARLYLGGEGQAIDSLIASAEGIANTPAYRGHAYAVFEDLQLASYGNRIPSLTFEVFADDGAVSLEHVILDMAGAGVNAACPAQFGGYAASGDSVRGAIEALTAAFPVRVSDDGTQLHVAEGATNTIALTSDQLGTTADRSKAQRLSMSRRSASLIPQTLVLAYYDAARDYQQGMQRARRDGGARKEDRLDLPVTLDPAAAKSLIETRLAGIWAERATAKISLPWRYLALRPGDQLIVPGSADVWRISTIAFNRMVLELNLVRTNVAAPLILAADAGRSVTQVDLPAGPTTLAVLDLSQLSDGVAAQPIVMAAAAGVSPGWRAAVLSQSVDNGASWTSVGRTASPAIIGTATTVLGAGSTTLIDMKNTLDVQLLNSDMQLTDASDALLLSGANLAMLGGELIQFGHALPLGGGAWRLSGLWRGQRGTEDRVNGHSISDRFVLIDTNTLAALSLSAGLATLKVQAQGVGDSLPAEVDILNPGLALRPPSPVALKAAAQSNGDMTVSWIRRSRDGWRWVDGVDAPLAEQQELYTVTITPSTGVARSMQVSSPALTYAAAQIAADKAAGATSAQIFVSQIGTMQASLATTLSLPLI